jgi:hypothetical protein
MKLNQVSGSRRSEGLLGNVSVSRFDVPDSSLVTIKRVSKSKDRSI